MRNRTTGLFTLALLGGYMIWRNRFEIQRFFSSRGIDLPLLDNSNVSNTVRSGLAKVTGQAESLVNNERKAI